MHDLTDDDRMSDISFRYSEFNPDPHEKFRAERPESMANGEYLMDIQSDDEDDD